MLLVTGANGQLGRRVVAHLLERVPADQVAVSVREPDRAADLAALGVSVRHGDFDEPAALPAAFAGVDRMLLISSSGLPHEVRFQHHLAAVTAARAAGVSSLVYTSLSLAAPASIGRVHRRTEESIVASGLPHTFLRHPLYMDNFIGGVLDEPELVSASGTGRVATALRDDLAEAAAVVLSTEGHPAAYDLTGPTAWSYDELAARASAVAGREIKHRAVSVDEYRELLRTEEVPAFLEEILVDIQTTIADGGYAQVTPDLAKLLGRPPRTLNETLVH